MNALKTEAELAALQAAHEVLVVFFTPPTCSIGVSLVDRVFEELQGRKIGAATVDTLQSPAIAGQHLVLAFPTIIVFVRGRELERLSGIFSMDALRRALDRAQCMVEVD